MMSLLAWAWLFTLPGLVLTGLGVPRKQKQAGYASLAGPFVHEALFGPGPHDTTLHRLHGCSPSKVLATACPIDSVSA